MDAAARAVIFADEVVDEKSWWIMFREKLEPLAERCDGNAVTGRTPSSSNLRRLPRARKEFKTAIFSAKEEWTTAFAKSVEKGQKNEGAMKYWEAVRKIKSGWNETKRVTHVKFMKEVARGARRTRRRWKERSGGSVREESEHQARL